jgi:ribosomal protein L37AE/L43A
MAENRSSKRFGSRYGNRIRKNVDEAEKGEEDYERVAAGIWKDKETGEVVAGGAYRKDTGGKEMLDKALELEGGMEELEEAKEEIEE